MKSYFFTKPDADNYFYILAIDHDKQSFYRKREFNYMFTFPKFYAIVSLEEMNRLNKEIERDHYKRV